MFKNAIVRKPGRSLVDGLVSTMGLGRPDYERALEQHAGYVRALEACGLDVVVLEALEAFPDSCFVEDVAVLFPEAAVLTNPGAESRNHEKERIRPLLEERFGSLERIEAPGTLEGGDVMQVGACFYIGLSSRTNRSGAEQLKAIVEGHGYKARLVPVTEVLHLKTGLTLFPEGFLLAGASFGQDPAFEAFERIDLPREEAYGANCLQINAKVLVPAGHPETCAILRARGKSVIEVEMSEFRKIDGGLTCLSLRY